MSRLLDIALTLSTANTLHPSTAERWARLISNPHSCALTSKRPAPPVLPADREILHRTGQLLTADRSAAPQTFLVAVEKFG